MIVFEELALPVTFSTTFCRRTLRKNRNNSNLECKDGLGLASAPTPRRCCCCGCRCCCGGCCRCRGCPHQVIQSVEELLSLDVEALELDNKGERALADPAGLPTGDAGANAVARPRSARPAARPLPRPPRPWPPTGSSPEPPSPALTARRCRSWGFPLPRLRRHEVQRNALVAHVLVMLGRRP